MRAIVSTLGVAFGLAASTLLSAQRPTLPTQEPTALVNANIVNVRDGKILPNATVVSGTERLCPSAPPLRHPA